MSTDTGADIIKQTLQTIPAKPGVYRMLNAAGDILYIGKAKHLPNRLNNYTNTSNLTNRIMRMVSQVAKLEVSITQSEAEALLLEATLIKQHQPRYNILLKDDKSFPYIVFTGAHDFPQIKKHRGAKKSVDQYFGPFASAGAVNQAITVLQKAFLLRNCTDHVFKNRSRPCLEYQIKRCTAPCVGYISKEDYADQVSMAVSFLRGKSREIQDQLSAKMQQASDAMEYEKAASLRDRIRALSKLQSSGQLSISGIENADIIALAREGAHSVIQVYVFRAGQHFGHQTFKPSHDEKAEDAQILEAFISQFYQRHPAPNDIYTSHKLNDSTLMGEALSLNTSYKVSLLRPSRGEKKAAIDRAENSARESLQLMLKARANTTEYHKSLAKLFGTKQTIKRIEVYDNSHVMGTYAVGGMVVATEAGFDKKSYRLFRFKEADITAGDDYGMMYHMLSRRLKRVKQSAEGDSANENQPDLLLIDGGKGQLSTALKVRDELGVAILIVAISKGQDRNAGREWFHLEGQQPFQLPPDDPTLQYLQRLRDEAHRFAITNHRSSRSKAISQSALDGIPGIGAKRKRDLMHHFGSRASVQAASIQELQQVSGISEKIAKSIYDYFHGA